MTAQTGAGGSNHLPPICVTVPEACRLLGVSRSTVWSLIGSGRIRVAKVGRRTLPLYRSLEALAGLEIADPGISKASQTAASAGV
jgi:excisionase family DNA binding protein